jgi:adenylate cyclase, class 2
VPAFTETEIKIRLEEPEAVRAALVRLGARRVQERHFEDNLLFDDAGGALRAAGTTVRLRRTPGVATLTCKGARRVEQGMRSRPEIETTVGDPDAMQAMLESLGLRAAFRYQKYRETWSLDGQEVVLDETPIGSFLEIEGDPSGIGRVAAALGFYPRDYLTDSYVALFFAGGGKGDMVFA